MKTIIQTILLGFFITVCSQALHSQNTVSYGYDAAGNRISRTIIIPSLKSSPKSQDEPPVIYSEMLSDIEVKIYPNPTDGLLKVEISNLPKEKTADILLYNLSGDLITSLRKIDNITDINIGSQPAGIYLMKIVAGEYQTQWKIIKK
jgi:hypothetical protein